MCVGGALKDRGTVPQVRGTGQAKKGRATEQKPLEQGQEAERHAGPIWGGEGGGG